MARGPLRVGTWNLAGRWSADHHDLMSEQSCDVWLLTEVSAEVALDGYAAHLTEAVMTGRRRWAAVFAREALSPLPDPHPASAAAVVKGLTYCSSILPWRSCGSEPPWEGSRHADKTAAAVAALVEVLPATNRVWGGDWNHALKGRESAGSGEGRRHLLDAITALSLHVPTATQPHQINGLLSIDHIGVPADSNVTRSQHLKAQVNNRQLSDHDAYVVEFDSAT